MIDFTPKNISAEVLQNVRTILATRRGSVPLDRAFGISWEHLDEPLPIAKMHTMSDVIDAVRRYEPRAVIEDVGISADTETAIEGALHVLVSFSLSEDLTEGTALPADRGTYTAEVTVSAGDEKADKALALAQEALRTAEEARQLAAMEIAAQDRDLAGLRELETTDYAEIFDGEQS